VKARAKNLPAIHRRRAKAPRPAVIAKFAVSWDGRIVEQSQRQEVERFRELAAGGLLDELWITFRPRIIGGKSAPPITGLTENFLPRATVLDLLKLERRGNECTARYRVRPMGR